MFFIEILLISLILIPTLYWISLAIASIRPSPKINFGKYRPTHRFFVAIPAHNESAVIGDTVNQLSNLDYPDHLYKIHVVADYCTDDTAEHATRAGAVVHTRNEGPRTGKGAALNWMFSKALDRDEYDAVIIFDADTKVDSQFLKVMDVSLSKGYQAIQGQHIISNPDAGWFPSLTRSMFLVDNRFQNLGRNNLGLSAKNMGDSISFRTDILIQFGWGSGLTEDYQFRQRMLLEGIKIKYQPEAKGYGEAPPTWKQAQVQRARWLRGTSNVSRELARKMFFKGVRQGDFVLIDGAFQAFFPSYSTLVLLCLLGLAICYVLTVLSIINCSPLVWISLTSVAILLFIYPLFGLFLERAPIKAYIAMLTGPFYIVWRSILAMSSRIKKKRVSWIRTPHGG